MKFAPGFLVLIIIALACFIFVGCVPVVPDVPEEPELPAGIIYNIEIEPSNPTVLVGDSVVLTVHAYSNFPEMEEVYIDGSKITWLDNCGEDVLDPLVGLSTVYTPNGAYDQSNISACYEWPKVEGCPFPQYLCTGITIDVIVRWIE